MADQNNPLVSIIMPSFNQGQFIRDTIQSCLEQDYRPIEIIVMDGASTDNTVEVLKSFGNIPELNWVSEPDEGVVDAVNKGLHKAKGEIAAIQSSDDYYLPGAFSVVVDRFKNSQDAGLVYGDVERVDLTGASTEVLRLPEFSMERLLSRELTIFQPAAFFSRVGVLQLGGWNPKIPYVPDTDLWIRLAFHVPVVKCRNVLAACRSHPGQRDTNSKRIYADYMKMLELSQGLKKAPMPLKRAARAGAAMLKFRYGGAWTDGQLTCAAWTAVFFRPALLRSPSLQKSRLMPGYFALTRLKKKIGCWLHERWRAELVLSGLWRENAWLDLCNRNETVTRQEDGIGRICLWPDSSFLSVTQRFPRVGKRLLKHTWPEAIRPQGPVSVILPVHGAERMNAVRFIAESMIGIISSDSEVLVCEHAEKAQYNLDWPNRIRHIFIQTQEGEKFSKSRAMNVGARYAKNEILIFLDADILHSPNCISKTLEIMSAGWEAVRPLRFLFLLEEEESRVFMRQHRLDCIESVRQVHQNFPGGMTAVRREVYIKLGGHDERFWGWGGEDAEFLDRLQMIRLYPGSFLPGIHLWHPAAT